jgi:hypothetical protein
MRRLPFVLFVAVGLSAHAYEPGVTFIEDDVLYSYVVRIARVKVKERQEVTWGSTACGFRYRVRAMEWLKGGEDEEFEFFDAHDAIGVGEESFVITQRWSEVQYESEARRRCLERGLPTGQIAIEHMLFDKAASEEFGGEWLRRRAAQRLYSREPLEERRLGKGEDAYSFFRWDQLKGVITKALRTP